MVREWVVTAWQGFRYVRHRVLHWDFKVPGWPRAGLKLEAALDAWALDVRGLRCLDAGVSTGGFTDCLLQRGAAHVVGVDVGYGQVRTQSATTQHGTNTGLLRYPLLRLLGLPGDAHARLPAALDSDLASQWVVPECWRARADNHFPRQMF